MAEGVGAAFPALNLLYTELERVAAEIRADWGSVDQVRTEFGIHGVVYVDAEDDEEGLGFATIGFVLPTGIWCEIESGTYGQLQGLRIYQDGE